MARAPYHQNTTIQAYNLPRNKIVKHATTTAFREYPLVYDGMIDTTIQRTTSCKIKTSKTPQQLHLERFPPNMNEIFMETTTKILD